MRLSQLERAEQAQITGSQPAPAESAIERAADRPAPAILAYALVLLPMITFYAQFLITYGHTYFQLRDENIMLAIFAEVRSGRNLGDIFTMIIPPAFVSAMLWLSRAADVLVLGRALCMISAAACALLTARIAKILFPAAKSVPLIALALIAGSALFVQEGTIFRLNLISLAFALASVALLLQAARPEARRTLGRLALAGLLFGLAVQVKALALAFAPFVLYACWQVARAGRAKGQSRVAYPLVAAAFVAGCVVPLALVVALAGGAPLDTQLSRHLDAAARTTLVERAAHTIGTFWSFAVGHFWLALFFLLGVGRASLAGKQVNRPRGDVPQELGLPSQAPIAQLAIWAGTVALVLLVNFPSWEHHYVYLLPPLAIGAALFLEGAGQALFAGQREQNRRSGGLRGLISPATIVYISVAVIGTFSAASAINQQQLTPDVAAVARLVEARTKPADIVWSDNMVFRLLTGRATDPQLVDLSMKRIISGQLSEAELFGLFERNPPAALIAYDGLFDAFPKFVKCVGAISEVSTISLNGQRVYWVDRANLPAFSRCGRDPAR